MYVWLFVWTFIISAFICLLFLGLTIRLSTKLCYFKPKAKSEPLKIHLNGYERGKKFELKNVITLMV